MQRRVCAVVSAALVINSIVHIGASLPEPHLTTWVDLGIFLLLSALWIVHAGSAAARLEPALVLGAIAISFAAGAGTRIALGSYRAMQESGLIGGCRLAAVALLLYGFRSREVAGGVQLER
jgi:hypothetical protein